MQTKDIYSLINKNIGYDFDGVLHKSIHHDRLNNIYVGPFSFQRTYDNSNYLIPNNVIINKIKFDICGNCNIYIITSLSILNYDYVVNFLQHYFSNFELKYMTVYMRNDYRTNINNLHQYIKFKVYDSNKVDIINHENIIEFTDDSLGTIYNIYITKYKEIENDNFLLYYSIPEVQPKVYYKINKEFNKNDFAYILEHYNNTTTYDINKINNTINYFIKKKKII